MSNIRFISEIYVVAGGTGERERERESKEETSLEKTLASFKGFSRAAAKSYRARLSRTLHSLLLKRLKQGERTKRGRKERRAKKKKERKEKERKEKKRRAKVGRHFSRFITKLCFANAFNGSPSPLKTHSSLRIFSSFPHLPLFSLVCPWTARARIPLHEPRIISHFLSSL